MLQYTFTAPTTAYLTGLGLTNITGRTINLSGVDGSSTTVKIWGKLEKGASATI